MKINTLIAPMMAIGLALSSAIALTSQSASAQDAPQDAPSSGDTQSTGGTTFECIKAGSGYATIAHAGDVPTEPLISWNSQAFVNSGYTPKSRCQEVTGRLNRIVSDPNLGGGSFSNILLTTGRLNHSNVVCWVNNEQSTCNGSNLLVTISPGREPGEFLAHLLNRRANAFQAGIPGQESERRTVVKFGQFVEQELAAAKTQPSGHNTNTSNSSGNRNPSQQPNSHGHGQI